MQYHSSSRSRIILHQNHFLDNGFPLEVIENVLNRKSQQWESERNGDILDKNAKDKPEVDYSKAWYTRYHPKAAKNSWTDPSKFHVLNRV